MYIYIINVYIYILLIIYILFNIDVLSNWT